MLIVPAVLGLLAAAAPVPPPAAAKPPLMLSVAVPAVHGRRTLELGGGFDVVVTNTSDKPVCVWRDWCSWGYFNLSLEFREEAGGVTDRVVVKAGRGWDKNYPDAAELAPGESIVFRVELNKAVWPGLGHLHDRVGKKVKMRVRYDVRPDGHDGTSVTDPKREPAVWMGSLRTAYQEYTIGQEKR